MARLPQPGGDTGSWGDILNDYLSQVHNGDGSLKDNIVGTSQLQTGSVAETNLSNAVQTKLNQPANIADGSITKAKLVSGVQSSLDKADSALQTAPVSSVNTRTGAITLTKADVGLTNVDNTADTAKPVSTAQQNALNLKAPLASPTFTGTVSGITKAMVGLPNVDNTADADKPISSATQTALDAKLNTSQRGAANGVSPLGSDSKVPDGNLPTRLSDASLGTAYAPKSMPSGITGVGRFDPSQSFYTPPGATLNQARAALGKSIAGTAKCEIAWAGPSTAQGYPNPIATQAPSAYLINLLNTMGLSTGSGWVWTANNSSTPNNVDARWTASGWTLPYNVGFKSPSARSTAAGQTLTFSSTDVGTIIEFFVTGASGAYTYSVDGGTAVAVAAGGSATANPTMVQITGLSNTTHTLVFTASTSANVFVAMARVRKATSVLVTNAGWGGATSSEWDTTTQPNAYFSLQPATCYGGAPNLVIFDTSCWINDHILSGWTAAQTQAAQTRIVQQFKARGSDVILFMASAPSATVPFGAYPVISDTTYQTFRQAIYAVADATTTFLIDAPDRHGSWATANANGVMTDAYHFTPAGSAALARAVGSLISA